MCLQPYTKKNPNYGLSKVGLNYLKDCDSQYISIPCGHCPECIANKQMSVIQRVIMEAKYNYVFFATLTYDNAHLPQLLTSTGYSIRFADIRHLQLLFKRLRDSPLDRPFRYFAVSELGSKKGRPHFHILFFLPRYDSDGPFIPFNYQKFLYDFVKNHFAQNVGTRKNPIYEPLFTFASKFYKGALRTNFDLHYVNPKTTDGGVSDVGFYCIKYMMKPSDRAVRLQQALRLNLDEDEYNAVWRVVRPRFIASKNFGLNARKVDGGFVPDPRAVKYLRDGILSTPLDSPFPYFYTEDGRSWPLARFFKNKPDVFTLMDAHSYYFEHPAPDYVQRNKNADLAKFYEHEKKLQKISDSDASALLDWIE